MVFRTVFGDKGDYMDVWMIKITNITIQIDMDVACFESRSHTKTTFVPKFQLFQLFYWYANLTLTDKPSAKNLKGLIRP